MRLHVGCGKRVLPDWTHVDIEPAPHVDLVCDARQLSAQLPPASVDELYACHILEHFARRATLAVLQDWWKVLREGGLLRIAVPDLAACVAEYAEHGDAAALMGLLCGGQRNVYDQHHVVFDERLLTALLHCAGFGAVQRYDASAFLPERFDHYSLAYLPHHAPTGRLMSLNLLARKLSTPIASEQDWALVQRLQGSAAKH